MGEKSNVKLVEKFRRNLEREHLNCQEVMDIDEEHVYRLY